MNRLVRWAAVFVAVGCAVAAFATHRLWGEQARGLFARLRSAAATPTNHGHAEGESAGGHGSQNHGHDHGGTESVTLTDQAIKNLGLQTGEIEPRDFWKTVVVPAVVAEQPGRSERRITSLLTGVVGHVYAMPGQTLKPGDRILDLRITGEGLIGAQSNLLRTLQEIALVDAELKRIAPIVKSGGLPEKNLIEREYERRRLESAQKVQSQELLVRGLTPAQVETIIQTQHLLRDVAIAVPQPMASMTDPSTTATVDLTTSPAVARSTISVDKAAGNVDEAFTVERIDVFPGKFVQPGDSLCDLALHGKLVIEGIAFESEAALVNKAIAMRWPIEARFDREDGKEVVRGGLQILYVENVVDPATRTLKFVAPFANEIVRDGQGDDGRDYRIWRFKPGQKLRVAIPVAKWEQRMVLPAEAIVREGPDVFAFRVNGKQMERVAVHVEYMDEGHAVLANDGSLFPGDGVALNGAYQLNLAIKRASGSGIDPHAGHNH